MKRKVSIFVAVVATVLAGCQEGNLTGNSVGNPVTVVDEHAKAAIRTARIPLNGTPKEPYPNSGLVFDISGFADYSLVPANSTENLFDLSLAINARLTPRADDQEVLSLASYSSHVVTVSEEGVTFLDVRYVFSERSDRLALLITFQVTTHNIEVVDMMLDFVE